MEQPLDLKGLLVRRKVTRALADVLRTQLKAYLATIGPSLAPWLVFGSHVQSRPKDLVRGADKAFKELQAEFGDVASARPYNLLPELASPFEVTATALEVTPRTYAHTARAGGETKVVTVTSPLKWVVTAQGFGLDRLRQLLADRNRSAEETRQIVLHALLVNVVVARQPGIVQLLEDLRFPVSTERWPELGGLPVTCVTAAISTSRPGDEVIIESTEIAGNAAFEELVSVKDVLALGDGFREKLLEVVRGLDPGLLS